MSEKAPDITIDVFDQFRLKGCLERARGSIRAMADLLEAIGDPTLAQNHRYVLQEIGQLEQRLFMVAAGGAPSIVRGNTNAQMQEQLAAGLSRESP